MPRSRSRSIESSSWSRISRTETVSVSWRMRSASVDLPWSMCAMIEKLRMCAWSMADQLRAKRPRKESSACISRTRSARQVARYAAVASEQRRAERHDLRRERPAEQRRRAATRRRRRRRRRPPRRRVILSRLKVIAAPPIRPSRRRMSTSSTRRRDDVRDGGRERDAPGAEAVEGEVEHGVQAEVARARPRSAASCPEG